jgi:hypothetical protein
MRQAKSCRPCAPSPINAAAFPAAPRAFRIQARATPERQRGGAAGQLDRYLAMRQAAVPPLVQRMKDEKEAANAARLFLELTVQEAKIIRKINDELEKFSLKPDKKLFETTEELIHAAQKDIGTISEKQAMIISAYAEAGAEIRSAFIQGYFPKLPKDFGKGEYEPEGLDDKPTYDAEWLQSLFDTLVAQTAAQSEDEELYRFRYLAYALQSMRDPIGTNQIRHLLALVGKDRKIVIGQGVRTDMSAGPTKLEDNEKATKTDSGKPENDSDLMEQAQGNLYVFMQLKYGKEIEREANPDAKDIGDVQVNLDKDTYLFPIFAGITKDQVLLFTTPKFTSVHHENGHLISMLQGKAGLGKQHKYKEALATLTSQEEAFNIFGSPRSDRAYAQLLGLPVRFDHKTLITYIEGAANWNDWAEMLVKSEKLTIGEVPAIQRDAARELAVLVAADWSGKTKYKSKPKGVVAIGTAMTKVKGAAQELLAAKDSALESLKRKSGNRTKATQDLYDLLAGLDVTDSESLTAFREGIAAIKLTL